ncbi:hypothetical protein M3Y98_00037300 [Aphelenchoides besseyi]|nr:hypothetical protein M3Y98_00037300 [Aphelenchoides besseyi]
MNFDDHQELKFKTDYGKKLEMAGSSNYFYPVHGKVDSNGFKLKGYGMSDFAQVFKGAPNFEKTWIGYKTSVEYLDKSNLTSLTFRFFGAKEYDPSKDKMPVYLVVIIIVAILVGLGVIVAAIVGLVCCCVVRRKNKKNAAPGLPKTKTYEARVAEAKSRAEFLGETLPEDRTVHRSFLEGRSKPKSKKYSVDTNAPLKPLTDEQLMSTAKS